MKTDVLIVGGGLVGCATAWMLAREGVGVRLIEAAVLNGAASGANSGSIHLQIPYPEYVTLGAGWAQRFAGVLPMMRDSVALWRELAGTLGPAVVTLSGGLLVAETPAQMAAVAAKAALERAHGIEVEVIGRAELRTLAPYVSERMIGGAWCPGEGKGDPLRAGPALAAAARAAGAVLVEHCALTGLERTADGWLAATTAGPVRARRVVNAAGAAAGRVAALAGLGVAVEGHPIQATVSEPAAPTVPHLLYCAAAKLTLKQLANGTVIVGGGWPSRLGADGRLSVDPASLAANMGAAVRAVPALAGLGAVRTWPAIVNGTADWRPLIGEARPGFFLALFPWMGFTGAPITARIVTDLVVGRRAPVDPALLLAA